MGGPGQSPGTYGQPSYGPPPDQGRPRDEGWSGGESEPPKRKSKRGLIIGLIAAVIVVVVGVGGYVGWSLTKGSSDFAVGTCVKQNGSAGLVVDCGTEGAFKITSIEDAVGKCPDANQPTLKLTEGIGGSTRYACLSPA